MQASVKGRKIARHARIVKAASTVVVAVNLAGYVNHQKIENEKINPGRIGEKKKNKFKTIAVSTFFDFDLMLDGVS